MVTAQPGVSMAKQNLKRRLDEIEQSMIGCGCPGCGRGVGPVQVVLRWHGDAVDSPTCCPQCGRRLTLRLRWPEEGAADNETRDEEARNARAGTTHPVT
ncbi:MAG TPA: hypothetical protein VGX03_22135 [Candidatus Binatia bacterium]|jgi:hypothetical protein|nr:hypothetical protein [Candidatus Binatia bacterium]